mmetsp:Transcript_29955/g.59280  ORF Transcript_29955/g.59280 Transcript_29955/m.59280 type:complete len:204 (+) Transcript_29955:470-1081(+)
MHNCSNELIVKSSNPKISRTPVEDFTVESSSHPIDLFTCKTTQSNSALYILFATPSLASSACLTFSLRFISTPRVTNMLSVRAVSKPFSSTPTKSATSCKISVVETIATSPPLSSPFSNFTCPKCRIPATSLRTRSTVSSLQPRTSIDSRVVLYSASSEPLRILGAPPCPVKRKKLLNSKPLVAPSLKRYSLCCSLEHPRSSW